MTRLVVRNLEVRYGDLVGVADVSLEVAPGAVVALLGSNGAGKTTTLNAIAGLVRRSKGTIEWDGEDIGDLSAYAIVPKGLTLSPEGWRLFVGQTVEQNLLLGATPLKDRSRMPKLLERVFTLFPQLAERRRQRAGTLSGGERQMLALGRALMSDPRLLMLDEPSLGLAPTIVESLYLAASARAGSHAAARRAEHRVRPRGRRLRLRAADRPHGAGRPGRGPQGRSSRAGDLSRRQQTGGGLD